MSLDINGYNDVFKAFVDFAETKAAQHNKKAVACGTLVNGALAGHKISDSDTDEVHKWSRTVDEKEANDRTRDIFRNAIIEMFGGEAKIPASVKKAMLMGDYGQGKPLTARRIIAVKKAIDADGAMREKGVSQFRKTETRDAARALGYRESELPKLARAINFYAQAMQCSEEDALAAVTEQGSNANRLMSYGGRFLASAENFKDGLALIDLFKTWYEDLSAYVTDLHDRSPNRAKRDYSTADTLTKLNAEFGYVKPQCRLEHERFVFEALAHDPKANLKATVGEEIFGVEKNSATVFVCQGFGASAWNTIAQIPAEKRSVVFKAFDRLCVLARNAESAKEKDVGVRYFSTAGANLAISRMIKNIDRLAALDARGKLTVKNILSLCFADMNVTGRYETRKLHVALKSVNETLAEQPKSSMQITRIMQNTGCTLAEAQEAYNGNIHIPDLPYVSSCQLPLDAFDTIAGARSQMKLDLTRVSVYTKTADPNRTSLLEMAHEGFRVTFVDGERETIGNCHVKQENADRIAQKIEGMCDRVHPRQTASVMSLLSQSGLSVLCGGLRQFGVDSSEHSPVDFTLVKNEKTGDIHIRYSSPHELKFAFEWSATVKLDGTVSTTPLRFTDETAVKAKTDAATEKIKATLLDTMLIGDGGVSEEDCANAVKKLVEFAKGDLAMLQLLTENNCDVAKKILREDDMHFRPDEEIKRRVAAFRNNIDELRMVTGGEARAFKIALGSLANFKGEPLAHGIITKVFASAKAFNVNALANIKDAVRKDMLTRVLCYTLKELKKICEKEGLLQPNQRSADDMYSIYYLILSAALPRLDNRTLRGVRDGLYSDNSGKVAEVLARIANDEVEGDENIKDANTQIAINLDHVVKPALSNLLGDALDDKNRGDLPVEGAGELTNAEEKEVYDVVCEFAPVVFPSLINQ